MKRLACILLTLIMLVSGIFTFTNVHAQPIGNVTLSTNTEWTTTQSPINLNGTVTVNSNVTLTIDPGVTINLGMYGMLIYGTLTAQGTLNSQIVFTGYGNQSIQPPPSVPIIFGQSSVPWNPTNNSGSIVQNAILNSVYINLNGASPEIDSCIFSYATPYVAPINIQTGSSAIISNNVINYNIQNYNYGVNSVNIINVYGGNPTIANNQFEGSLGGINNVDIAVSSGAPVITGNTFGGQYGNNSFGVKINSGSPQIMGDQFEGNGWLTGIDSTANSAFMISNNVFSNCFIGVSAEAGTLTVQGNQFLKGTDGVDISSVATVTVTGNLIDRNSRYGINGGGDITSNTITNNWIGIHNPPSGTISDNNIVGNTLNSITTTTSDIDAQNNWWGITDAQTINQTIYDAKVDPHLGTVIFVPFLTQPSSSAPAIPSWTPNTTPIPTQTTSPPQTSEPIFQTPTSPPNQDSQSFVYQVGGLLNLNLIATFAAATLILVWIVLLFGYAAKKTFKTKE